MQMSFTRQLLVCGVVAATLFIVTDIVAAALLYPGYDYAAQQVSELSAIGAPSRDFWMVMAYPYGLLTVAFAVGVWLLAGGSLSLRLAAVFILLFAANSFAWGWVAPMHMRGTQFTDSDTMHIAFAVSAVVLMTCFIGFGASARGRDFRIYSGVTLALIILAGAVVSTQIPAIAANQATPWMGLVERISVYGPLIWIAIFGVVLMGNPEHVPQRRPA